ncbi:OmpA family protein [Pleionea sediminis]|uniref:OmpA family protein n=1 Tax=Pleionea sediminis TaxID=2569479 RepID=UPI001186E856|nr:OmpA family protein [Pleionea sediminis]
MKKALVITSMVLATLTQAPSAHAEHDKEKGIGIASGAAVGAAAGGPVGFVIGAAIGGLLGEEVGKANQVDDLKIELTEKDIQNSQLERELSELKSQTHNESSFEGSEMLQMDLLFSTKETGLDDTDRSRIEQLASFLVRYPQLTIKLDGFADPRGNQEENQKLSEQRIESVKSLLMEQGINEERIISAAHGEKSSVAPEGDYDAYALERRVSIRFFPQSDQTFAANE